MLEDFIKYLQENKLSENTYQSYVSDVKMYMKYYEDSYGENLEKLNGADIKTYISYLKNQTDTKPTTVNRYLSSLKSYNEFLVQNKIQNDIVISKRDFIKIQPVFVKEDLPEEKEINKLKHVAVDNKRDYCLICLATYGGFRASELVSIKISHIHLKERYIDVIGKGNKYRVVTINDIMYEAIEEYLHERDKVNTNNIYLFIGKKSNFYNNQPLNRNFVNRILNKYNTFVQIDNLHPHTLRHFFCTNAYYKAGYTKQQIASQAGHSSTNTTDKYIDNHNKDMLKLANSL